MSDALLAGPRGHRLCLDYACRDEQLQHLVGFYGFHRVDASARVIAFTHGGPAPIPNPTVTDIADRLFAIPETAIDDAALAAALRTTVDVARYWQEPDLEDRLAARPEIVEALRPLARRISAHIGSAWDRGRGDRQWAVHWREREPGGPLPTAASDALATWAARLRAAEDRAQRELPDAPTARVSGEWWSIPLSLLSTSGSVLAALDLVEDSFGDEVATVIPVRGSGRTLEIRGPSEWVALCREFPMEVTASRRHDWYRTTDRDGRWLLPDWQRVGERWDAVHLTTLGYLTAATRLIEIDDEYASVIGGWAPDSTLWLRDTAVEVGPRQEWAREHAGAVWARGPAPGADAQR